MNYTISVPAVKQDVDTEKCLLATLIAPDMADHAEQLVGELSPGDFVHPIHREVWRSFQRNVKDGAELGLMSIWNDMKGRNVTTVQFTDVVDVLSSIEIVMNPKPLVKAVKESAIRRRLQTLANKLMTNAADPQMALEQIIHETMEEAGQAINNVKDDEIFSANDLLTEYVDKDEPMAPLTHKIGCFGLAEVDDVIEIPVAEPMIIGARPGCGKTALGIQVCLESKSRFAEVKPMFISLELIKPKLLARVSAYLARGDARDFRQGHYAPHKAGLREKAFMLQGIAMACPNQGTPWAKLESMIRREHARSGVNLVVIDYFGYIGRPPVTQGSNVAYAYASVMDGVTALAKDLQIGLIMLAQLKQPLEPQIKRPHEGSFADSDKPYRDANVAVMLWKDAQDVTHLYNPKNREGIPGKEWDLNFDGKSGRFTTVVHETKENTYGDWR